MAHNCNNYSMEHSECDDAMCVCGCPCSEHHIPNEFCDKNCCMNKDCGNICFSFKENKMNPMVKRIAKALRNWFKR